MDEDPHGGFTLRLQEAGKLPPLPVEYGNCGMKRTAKEKKNEFVQLHLGMYIPRRLSVEKLIQP